MVERRRAVFAVTGALIATGLFGASAPARPLVPPRSVVAQAARDELGRQVLRCLRRSHLAHVTASAAYLWLGWDPTVGGFVYVQRYRSARTADKQARFLAAEETGRAGTLVVSQHIAPYVGSPVPGIVRCLHGRMVSKPPKKHRGTFTF